MITAKSIDRIYSLTYIQTAKFFGHTHSSRTYTMKLNKILKTHTHKMSLFRIFRINSTQSILDLRAA